MPRRREHFAQRAVLGQFCLVSLELFPWHIGREAVANEYPTLVVGLERAAAAGPSRNLLARIDFPVSPAICAGVDWVTEHVQQRHVIWSPPLELATVGAAVRSNRQHDLVANEPPQQAVHATATLELFEDQSHDRLNLFVRIDREVAAQGPHVTDRCMVEHFPTLGFVPHPLHQAALENVQLRLVHRSLQAEQQPVVVLARVVKAVCIRQQRAVDGAQLQQRMPILAGARQPAHLQAQNQTDPIRTDFRQHALEAAAPLGRTAAVPLVFVDHLHRRGGPAERHRTIRQGVLPQRRLSVFEHLLGRRLPHVHNRGPFEMLVGDLLGTKPGRRRIASRGRRPRLGQICGLSLSSPRAMNRGVTHRLPPCRREEPTVEPESASVGGGSPAA